MARLARVTPHTALRLDPSGAPYVTDNGAQVRGGGVRDRGDAELCTADNLVSVPSRAPLAPTVGNYIVDCKFPEGIADPKLVGAAIKEIVGVVEHGLFIGMASDIIVADPSGVKHLSKPAL